jgi:hypothetical protein
MSSARYPLPTDIVALVSFDGRVYPNEAKPLDRLGLDEKASPLETALEQWFSFATGKHAWVSVRGATIRGLISARQRAKRSVWEVEVLINTDEDSSVALSLFSRMIAGLAKVGAERVFLRLREGSSLVDCAKGAGFFAYTRETLYRREKQPAPPAPSLPLRPRARGDQAGIYQLYLRTVPANVRAIEGPTLRLWQAAQERWVPRPTDLVHEENGLINCWLRVAGGQVGRFALLIEENSAPMDDVVRVALSRLEGSDPVFTLVPGYQAGVAAAVLESLGFEADGHFLLMAKRLAATAEEAVLETSRTAVPVS